MGGSGLLTGKQIVPVNVLTDFVTETWGKPRAVVCDFFKLKDLQDELRGVRIEPRRTRWSEASADIRALRSMALDGNLSCEPSSRLLVAASLAQAQVVNDDAGNTRLVKKGTGNTGRDDVAAALTLAAGYLGRHPKPRGGPRITVVG